MLVYLSRDIWFDGVIYDWVNMYFVKLVKGY